VSLALVLAMSNLSAKVCPSVVSTLGQRAFVCQAIVVEIELKKIQGRRAMNVLVTSQPSDAVFLHGNVVLFSLCAQAQT